MPWPKGRPAATVGRIGETKQAVIDALKLCDWTKTELAHFLGKHKNTIDGSIRSLNEAGQCYIVRWQRAQGIGGTPAAIWRWGAGLNAKKPQGRDRKAEGKRRRAKEKAIRPDAVKYAAMIGLPAGPFDQLLKSAGVDENA